MTFSGQDVLDYLEPETVAAMRQAEVLDVAAADLVRLMRRTHQRPDVEYRCAKGRCLLLAAYRTPKGIVCHQGAVRLSKSQLSSLKWLPHLGRV